MALLPARLLATGVAFFLVRLFPCGDGACFTAVHLLVHACAVGARDGWRCSRLALVVINALVDPLYIVGIHLLSRRWGRGETQDQRGRDKQELHSGGYLFLRPAGGQAICDHTSGENSKQAAV